MSMAYRSFDIEAGSVMITRDVEFDKPAFGFSPALPEEIVEDTALDFDSLAIDDGAREMDFKWLEKKETTA